MLNACSMTLLLLLLSHFIHVQLCAIPETAAHKAPLSLGFSRQEHWSGLHFLLQCMKVKSESSVVSNSSRSHGLQPTRLLHPWYFPGKSTGVGCHCLLLYAEYIMRNAGLEEHKLETRFLGEISITSDMQMTPPLWQKVKRNSKAS